MKPNGGLTATQRFCPENQRLRSRARMHKLSLNEIEAWLAHGIMMAAALQRVDYTYNHWSGGTRPRMEKRSMREWCIRTMRALEEVRSRKLRVAMMIPQPAGEIHAERQKGQSANRYAAAGID